MGAAVNGVAQARGREDTGEQGGVPCFQLVIIGTT